MLHTGLGTTLWEVLPLIFFTGWTGVFCNLQSDSHSSGTFKRCPFPSGQSEPLRLHIATLKVCPISPCSLLPHNRSIFSFLKGTSLPLCIPFPLPIFCSPALWGFMSVRFHISSYTFLKLRSGQLITRTLYSCKDGIKQLDEVGWEITFLNSNVPCGAKLEYLCCLFIGTLLRSSLHTIQVTHVQFSSSGMLTCATINIILEHLDHPRKKSCTHELSLPITPSPQALVTTNLLSV